jgi:dethiobiotin synthetase
LNKPIFITGIGTGVGKTLISAILTEALQADYWKPIQAGFEDGTDRAFVETLISNQQSTVHPELYRLQTPASPHIAARLDDVIIDISSIQQKAQSIMQQMRSGQLVIEGAGGLLVPLTETSMVADLITLLNASVILVSRNYLGSINHSLLTAAYCRAKNIHVAGWIFNDDYMNYESEIVQWSGYPSLGSIPKMDTINKETVRKQANRLMKALTDQFNQQ